MSSPNENARGRDRDRGWFVSEEESGVALSSFVRARTEAPWSKVKRWITSGKVSVDERRETDPGRRLGGGSAVALQMNAPRNRRDAAVAIVYEDAHVVVIDKAEGIPTVPYEPTERGTALDHLRDVWRRRRTTKPDHPLMIVHRLDKATSGLLVLAKTKRAEQELARQFRAHTAARTYLCVAHGRVESQRIESRIVSDRGDRLRGSTRQPGRGKRAVTHVKARESLAGATLCEVALETGKTHQIRVHLSENGHPIVGDPVYTRDFARAGRRLIESQRVLLHAQSLGFEHPVTGQELHFDAPPPQSFADGVEALRRRSRGRERRSERPEAMTKRRR